MIKYLKISCLLCLLLFVGLGIYGKNKFEKNDYQTLAKEKYYSVMAYQDFLEIYPNVAKEMIDDSQVSCLKDMIQNSDYVLKVKNGNDKIIKGEGLINQCQVLEVFKGDGIKVNDQIFVYDLTYCIVKDSVGYIEGSKPLVPDQESVVFLQKASAPNMKDSYIFSSINYGFFAMESQNRYIGDYENELMSLEETYAYDYIGTNEQFLKTYKQIVSEIRQGKILEN